MHDAEPALQQVSIRGDLALHQAWRPAIVDDLQEPVRVCLSEHAADRTRQHVQPPTRPHHDKHAAEVRQAGIHRLVGDWFGVTPQQGSPTGR